MKVKRLMASLLCGAIGAATLGLSGCGSAADSGMMDAANANAVAGGSSGRYLEDGFHLGRRQHPLYL